MEKNALYNEVLSIAQDIKHRAEQEEVINSLIIDRCPIGIVILRSVSDVLYRVNKTFCGYVGYTKEELTSAPFYHFLYEKDMKQTFEIYNISKKYKKAYKGEGEMKYFINRYVHKNGELVPLYWYLGWLDELSKDDPISIGYCRIATEQEVKDWYNESI